MGARVAIIILNWNGWDDTIECLKSVYRLSYPALSIVVVDNGSFDDSAEQISRYCRGEISIRSPDFTGNRIPIHLSRLTREQSEMAPATTSSGERELALIENEKNYGFAEGNNIGIRYALQALRADYIFLLNNDAVICGDIMDGLVSIAGSDPRIGIIGPKICHYYDPTVIWSAGGRVNLFTGQIENISQGSPDEPVRTGTEEVDYVSGCALLIKREVIEQIGLLDPAYFCYFEETDWAMRAKRCGYASVIDYDSCVLHKDGATVTRSGKELRYYYFPRNTLIFLQKNGNLYHFPSYLAFFTIRYVVMIGWNVMNRQPERYRKVVQGVWDFIRQIDGEYRS
jgi:GT2 family glycosyltransferase